MRSCAWAKGMEKRSRRCASGMGPLAWIISHCVDTVCAARDLLPWFCLICCSTFPHTQRESERHKSSYGRRTPSKSRSPCVILSAFSFLSTLAFFLQQYTTTKMYFSCPRINGAFAANAPDYFERDSSLLLDWRHFSHNRGALSSTAARLMPFSAA